MIKKLSVMFGLGGLLCTPALEAQMTLTMIDNTSQYSYGVGGEFRAVGNPALDAAVNWNAYSSKTQGTISSSVDGGAWGYNSGLNGQRYFQTFCTETEEDFSPGSSYPITSIGTAAMYAGTGHPVPITLGVAYLYSQFAAGTLAGYTYTYGTDRSTSAGTLQEAIWYLLGEYQYGAALAGFALTDLQNSGIPQAKWTNPANGSYGVADMVLDAPGQAQDQLVMVPVPEPTTLFFGAMLLLPFGVSTLRFGRRNRAV